MKNALALSALLALLTACGAQGPSTDDNGKKPAAAEPERGAIWLPPFTANVAGIKASSPCKPGLEVELGMLGEQLSGALLADKVVGPCKTDVQPNKRFYELKLVSMNCGSRVYEGKLEGASEMSRLMVTDHSRRICDDRKPGMIEIVERGAGKPRRVFAGEWPH